MLLCHSSWAFQPASLPSDKLVKRSALILIGEVTSVKDNTGSGGDAKKGAMYISVEVGAVLKGKTKTSSFTLELDYGSSRQSVDPKVKKGEVCVFFLKELKEGEAILAHPGSLAPFRSKGLYRR